MKTQNKQKNTPIDLVIMAAGMGSRFGGLKQIEPMDEDGNFLIDYSIYDAIRYGVTKVVFIIKEENYDLFRNTVGKRIEDKIKVEYVFQKITDLPEGFTVPEGREKPWGTGHAILACRNVVHNDFIIINADDFYGADAYKTATDFIKQNRKCKIKNIFKKLFCKKDNFALIGYEVANTITDNGSTKRGVCEEKNGSLVHIDECSVEKKDGKIFATPLETTNTFEIQPNQLVSMNMWAFSPILFDYIGKQFPKFLEENLKTNPLKCEFYIPLLAGEMAEKKLVNIKVKNTSAKWIGVTYKEDKPLVVESLKKLRESGEYPEHLWEK